VVVHKNTVTYFRCGHCIALSNILRWILLVGLFITACTQADKIIPTLTGNIPIHAPSVANAGSAIEVMVGPVNVANGTPIGLVMVGVDGPKVYNTVFQDGQAYFKIPPSDTYQPGYVALIVASQEARGETSIIVFLPRRSNVGRDIFIADYSK
jgi:hypothetical protein